tara:strand:- start:3578 stop:3859 length:282 start_codon:yes stop_codon:yes gene_type:complete
MGFFTLIIDYDGGTYISQATAENIKTAPIACVQNWQTEDIKHLISDQDRNLILEQLTKEEFVSINGLKNIWCGCAELNQHLLTMNLVLTKSAI